MSTETDPALVERVARAIRNACLPEQISREAMLEMLAARPSSTDMARAKVAITETLAALRESGRLVEWRPIESAPKDGAWILGWAERDSSPYRVSWGRNHNDTLAWCTTFGSFIDGYITHWQPLEAPPATAATEGE